MILSLGWFLIILTTISFISKKNKIAYLITALYSFIFSLYMSYHMWFKGESLVQSFSIFIISIYTLYILYIIKQDNFYPEKIFKMISISGIFLLSLYSIDSLNNILISAVANETNAVMNSLGFNYEVINNNGYYIKYDENLKSQIVLACTGIGSISIFIGLLSAIESINIKEKLSLILAVSGFIYILNTVRNVFISISYGEQLLHIFPNIISKIFGKDGTWISYYVADKIISQILALIFLVSLTILIFNNLSEDSRLEEEIIYIIDRSFSTINDILL